MKHQTHGEYLALVKAKRLEREREIHDALLRLFSNRVVRREVEVIELGKVTAKELAASLLAVPRILKPMLVACNMGKLALRGDLGIEVDTINPRLTPDLARTIADYLLPQLPESLTVDSLVRLDAYQFVDSEIRKHKGRWETRFRDGLLALGFDVRKRKFINADDEEFELDIAWPATGPIVVGVDVKMIGHSSDVQKRGDEIVNKAANLKRDVPKSVFISIVHYRIKDDEQRLRDRLRSPNIDEVLLAGDDDESIEIVVGRLAEVLRARGAKQSEQLALGPPTKATRKRTKRD